MFACHLLLLRWKLMCTSLLHGDVCGWSCLVFACHVRATCFSFWFAWHESWCYSRGWIRLACLLAVQALCPCGHSCSWHTNNQTLSNLHTLLACTHAVIAPVIRVTSILLIVLIMPSVLVWVEAITTNKKKYKNKESDLGVMYSAITYRQSKKNFKIVFNGDRDPKFHL